MVSPFDIRNFAFPTLADPSPEAVIDAVQILRREAEKSNDRRRGGRFKASDRERFQREALTGDSRIDRVLATLDAIIQQNPATALGAVLPGPMGAIPSLGGLIEGQQQGRTVGDLLRELARASTREGTATTSRRGGGTPTAVEREFRARAEREDRRANRELREGRGSGASPRRGDVSNAGR